MRTLLFCSALLLAAPGLASAQPGDAPPMAGPATSASDYMMKAGQSDQFELQEGRLAQQMGSSAAVKMFGAEMIKDHTKSTKMVMAAAMKSGLPTPAAPPPLRPDQEQMVAQLQGATGADFDRIYVTQQLQAHQEALALQSGYAKSGDDKNLKATAGKITPVVQKHLGMLQKMQSGAKMSDM